ncbi:hypothetical protein ACFPPA_05785 [Rhodanobacter ginsengisoli]|uniref:Uncharacterized protein n=1 Tax=Rhodanobacter ginsengisoli TaxID=418646 RepID=A0ABW0QLL6_9GAMM
MNLTNAIRKALQDSGAPLTIDQLMEQLPDDADRHTVGSRCRGLKQAGEIIAQMEDGKVAYAWVGGRRLDDRVRTLTERIRELLRAAAAPMTAAEVCAALPDDKDQSIQSLLSQLARAGALSTVTAGGRKLAYCIADKGGVSVAVNVGNVTTSAAPAPAPAAPATPASPRETRPKVAVTSDQASALDRAVFMAENAREAYVLSKVDDDVYTWLQESVRAACAARDAFAGGAK